jgi:hypothetical protein
MIPTLSLLAVVLILLGMRVWLVWVLGRIDPR